MTHENEKFSQIVLSVLILSLTIAVLLGVQAWTLVSDRATLDAAFVKQEQALAEIDKAKSQVSALVKGAMELAKSGNKNAQELIEEMKKAGVNFQDPPKPVAEAPSQKTGSAVVPPASGKAVKPSK